MAKTLAHSAAISPGQRSFATLKRYVVDYVQGGDDPELLDIAGRAINKSIDLLNAARMWIKMTGKQDIVTTLDVADYQLNKDFKDPIELVLMDINQYPKSKLDYLPYRLLTLEIPDGTEAGKPEAYTIYYQERLLSLARAPVQNWVDTYPYMRLRYHQRLVHLVGEGDIHGGPPEFDAFISWRARFDIAAVRGERGLASLAHQESDAILSALRRSDNEILSDWS